MASPVTTEEFLLPYEWPGSYFIGEEEIDAVTKTLLARSPYRFYGHDLWSCLDRCVPCDKDRRGCRRILAGLERRLYPE